MSQVILKLCFLVTLFMMLVDAQRRRGQGTPDCMKKGCPSNRTCARVRGINMCVVPHGGSCTSNDICEGGYYCIYGNTCSGEGGLNEGDKCERNECKRGLYCDLSDSKCHKIGGDHDCYSNAECSTKCYSPKGCYCHNQKCVQKS